MAEERRNMALQLQRTDPKEFNLPGGGRPICRVECEGRTFDIGTSNVAELEKDPDTPRPVKDFIGNIWETLALPGCSIDAELLRHVMDFGSSCEGSADFWDRTNDVREQERKISKRASSWVLEPGTKGTVAAGSSGDLVRSFFRSKLGILLLRGMLNLSSMWTDPPKDGRIPLLLLDSMDKQFTSSPLCCLYVKGMEIEVSSPNRGKTHARTNLKLKREVPKLVGDFAPSPPSSELLGKVPGDAFGIYGQLSSGYVGCLGDFYCGSDEFEARKRSIEDKWKAATNREQRTGQVSSRSKYKWFDNFAGTDDVAKAATRMILTDCPPVSLWATLSNMKRNLVCLAYMCKVFEAGSKDSRSSLYSRSADREEVLVEMAEFVCSFFTEDGSLALSKNFPLRVSKQNKTPYLSVKDYIVKPVGGMGGLQFVKKVRELGLTDHGLLQSLAKAECSTCIHVPFYNALSMSEMDHSERVSLTEQGHEDHKSLVLVPVRLGSWEQDSSCKFSAGIKTGYGSWSTGVVVGKGSILFKRNENTLGIAVSPDERVKELAESFRMLVEEGMTKDSAASAMSLSPQMKEKVLQFLDDENAGPSPKRARTSL